MAQQILIPDIGDIDEVQVIEICVTAGDNVVPGDALVVIESDKASMEVPVEMAGVVDAILVKVGDVVAQGHPVATVVAADAPVPVVEAGIDEAARPIPQVPPAPELPDEAVHSEALEVRVPDIGEAIGVVVIEVAVRVGQQVAAEDLLVVVESDKASMEIPAGLAGTVLEIHVTEGADVAEGTLLVTLEGTGLGPDDVVAPQAWPNGAVPTSAPAGSGDQADPSQTQPSQGEAASQRVPESGSASAGSRVYAGPAVRRLARELGVELAVVPGSGSRGRIVKDDVKEFVKEQMLNVLDAPAGMGAIPTIPTVDFSKFGATDLVPLTRIRAVGATNLHRSWLNIPHVTQHDEADVTELEAFRATLKDEATRRGVKITPLAFVVKACCYALKDFPTFNSSLDAGANNFILKRYYHIGFAVDTAEGLLVPVLKDADKKGVWELSSEITDLANKAREQKLSMSEMQGGCFSVSSLGAIGGTAFTPIINAPEVAILGVARLAMRPVWDGEGFAPRQMLPLSLSYDHRAINGAEAGRFVSALRVLLSDIRRLSL